MYWVPLFLGRDTEVLRGEVFHICINSNVLEKKFTLKKKDTQDFPGGAVVQNPPANVGGGVPMVREDSRCCGATKSTLPSPQHLLSPGNYWRRYVSRACALLQERPQPPRAEGRERQAGCICQSCIMHFNLERTTIMMLILKICLSVNRRWKPGQSARGNLQKASAVPYRLCVF